MTFSCNDVRPLVLRLYVPRTFLDQFFLIRRKLEFHLRPKHHLTNQFRELASIHTLLRQLFRTGTYTASSTRRYIYQQSPLIAQAPTHTPADSPAELATYTGTPHLTRQPQRHNRTPPQSFPAEQPKLLTAYESLGTSRV